MMQKPPAELPIRPSTQALAALQTRICAAGLAQFEGDLDRFGIFSLVLAQTHRDVPNGRPIAVYSLAMSLNRPFETVRRHINALLAAGLCDRYDGKIGVSASADDHPGIAEVRRIAHDSFVRFASVMRHFELLPPLPAATRAYHPIIGVIAAVETLLAAVGSNRTLHDDWLSLSIFSAVLLANAQRYRARAPLGGVPMGAPDAVRSAAIARALNLPETTVRRRAAALTAPDGPLVRLPAGLLGSERWLTSESAGATSDSTYAHVRLILARAAAQGFPFDDPDSAYLAGPPAMPRFD